MRKDIFCGKHSVVWSHWNSFVTEIFPNVTRCWITHNVSISKLFWKLFQREQLYGDQGLNNGLWWDYSRATRFAFFPSFKYQPDIKLIYYTWVNVKNLTLLIDLWIRIINNNTRYTCLESSNRTCSPVSFRTEDKIIYVAQI